MLSTAIATVNVVMMRANFVKRLVVPFLVDLLGNMAASRFAEACNKLKMRIVAAHACLLWSEAVFGQYRMLSGPCLFLEEVSEVAGGSE